MKITAIYPRVVWVGSCNQLIVKIEIDAGGGESGQSGRRRAVLGRATPLRK